MKCSNVMKLVGAMAALGFVALMISMYPDLKREYKLATM